jgi:hypothetical protein
MPGTASRLINSKVALKIAVISDIHANLEGLGAALADIAVQESSIYCLGDIVGWAGCQRVLCLCANTAASACWQP